MVRIAIFASGNGSNAENIINYFKDSSAIKCELIISNKENAYVLERASKHKISARHVSGKEFRENPKKVSDLLVQHNIDFIVLAGFMLLLPEKIIRNYPDRIVNIHPALLPSYGGKGMYGMNVHRAVINAGETQSGISIHYVNEKYDEGRIIFQAACPVDKNDTPDTLAEKIHHLEYKHYPAVIEQIIHENILK
ncbi:MAG: phosphoribosylglycinamide formyltransferase [Bacteroidales bacterium]|nr:phosphoribosylglycinamide formyltransferase [Bacteroidales bacterium]